MNNIHHDNAKGHLDGTTEFIEDRVMAKNEVYVSYIASPYAKAKILERDYRDAKEIEGVLGIWDYRDLSGNLWGNINADQPILAEAITHYVGEPLAIVAATSVEALQSVRKLRLITFEELPAVLNLDEAIEEKDYLGDVQVIKRGDFDSAYESAPLTLSGEYENRGQEHFYLESQAAIAYPVDNDEIDILSSSQNPTEIQHVVAKCLGLKLRQVTSKVKRMGGAFGGKETQSVPFAVMAAFVAYRLKRPARIILSKADDMIVTGKRHPFKGFYRVGFNAEGIVLGLETKLFADGGAYTDISPSVVQRAILHSDNAYYVKNWSISGVACKTNHHPHTAFRGFGAPQGIALVEQVFDEIAYHLKIDPLSVRERNLYGIDKNNTAPYTQEITQNTLPQIVEKLANSSHYKQRRKAIEAFNRESKTSIKGIGLTPVKFGISFTSRFLNQGNALVNVFPDASVQISTGATEMGQGVNTKIAQVVAQTLGVDVSMCKVMITSTEKNHNTSPTAASSGTDLNASAANLAALKIKNRLLNLAAQLFLNEKHDAHFEYSVSEVIETSHINIENGVVQNRETSQKMALTELLNIAYENRISMGDYAFYKTPNLSFDVKKGEGKPFAYYTNCAAVSEVTIDRFSGKTSVDRVEILMDLGRSLNEGIDRGQVAGAFVQCMGWVTNENLVYSDKGALLSHSPTTYKIPNIQDIPSDFVINFLDNPYEIDNIRGSKAVGEPPFILGLSVLSAIRHALSSKGFKGNIKIPATSENILMKLESLR